MPKKKKKKKTCVCGKKGLTKKELKKLSLRPCECRIRTCLRCDRQFLSEGRQTRVCLTCKKRAGEPCRRTEIAGNLSKLLRERKL